METNSDSRSGFSTSEEQPHERIHREVAKKAALEGIVLLENKEGVLPLEEGASIALYGRGASRTIKGGTGSGDVNEREDITVFDGLKAAGFNIVNEKWISDYDREYEEKRRAWRDGLLESVKNADGGLENFFNTYAANPFPAPAGGVPEKENCNTALYVLSRTSGEAADRRNIPGDYYLTEEEEAFLDDICRLYDRVIVIINTGSVMDLSFMDSHKNILGLIFMCQAGMEGGAALADLLSGKASPGGHLTDTWCYDYEDYPGAMGFSYINEDLTTERYEEGIYSGYRYFDSLGIPVRYGFGYGLTYSEFILEAEEPSFDEGIISVPVTVTNIGDRAAREVVQVYVSCPQTGLEKEFRRLAGFKKTGVIAPKGREELKIDIPVKMLSSYDSDEAAWTLEKGFHGIWCGFSLDKSALVSVIELDDNVILERCRNLCSDTSGLKEFSITAEEREELASKWMSEAKENDLPVLRIKAENISSIENSYGRDDDIPEDVKTLTDGLEREKLISLLAGAMLTGLDASVVGASGFQVPGGAGDTSCLAEDEGIPSIVTADGPAGLRLQQRYFVKDGKVTPEPFVNTVEHGFFREKEEDTSGTAYYQYCTAFPVGTLLASTWDLELLWEVGKAVGEEMELFGVDLWLAPGMNNHRNPLCGRNFEYFSEDPLVSGETAAAITLGVQSVKGRGTTIKHFACNNAEDNRFFSNSVLSERTLREIYLRGFEIAVKKAKPHALMTSYNKVNGVHAANNKELISNILRDEWGFDGLVMTDWQTTWYGDNCNGAGCVAAGNDLIMPGHPDDLQSIRDGLESGIIGIEDVKKNAYRVVRTIMRLRKTK